MVRKTILEGDPILRQTMPNIAPNIRVVGRIVQDLMDTMFATNAIGFAANQIGEPWNICIVKRDPDSNRKKDVLILVNPKIISRRGSQASTEACKSLPGYIAVVPRSKQITVVLARAPALRETYATTLIGMPSIIAQHEIDHLNGILLKDYVEDTNGKSGGVHIIRGERIENL